MIDQVSSFETLITLEIQKSILIHFLWKFWNEKMQTITKIAKNHRNNVYSIYH